MKVTSQRSLAALGAAVVLGLSVTSCAGRMENTARRRAATDFDCSESDITVTEKSSGGLAGEYEAHGCGRSRTYLTRCSVVGFCFAETRAEVRAQDAEYARQREARARAEQRAPAPPPPSSSSASSSPAASGESYPENCGFDSDCGPGVKCNNRRCADTGGSKCGFDSDCGGNGAKCNSGKCSNAPDGKCAFDSQCPGGKCSSGKCKF